MAHQPKAKLLEYCTEAIESAGWNVLYIETTHPFLLRINKEGESYLVRIFIWNMTHGGGSKRSDDEYRIQITGVGNFFQNQGEVTLILGWWDEAKVFAGFDFTFHKGGLGKSPSMQIKEENLRKAVVNGFSPYKRYNNEIAIAFKPEFFVEYIRLHDELHQIIETERQAEIVDAVVADKLKVNSKEVGSLTKKRQEIIIEVKKKIRSYSFNTRVLRVYNNRCAISGIQLKLVDAAHILPVSELGSTDETCNGIALSALHHRAFDKGLLTFDDSYRVYIRETQMVNFRAIGFDGGEKQFRSIVKPILDLPPSVDDRPAIGFINAANKLRKWIAKDFR